MRPALFACLCSAASAAGPSKAFPPGWNGLAKTPPLGWRSWNAFGNRITQQMMLDAATAITTKNRTVKGWDGAVSLWDLGYKSVGVDEGWEGCGQGVDKTQHDAAGLPTIDSNFPDTKKMVQQIHALNLSAGWYLNGCKCGEHVEKRINYEGDIKDLHDFDFDGVKIDGCGKQRNQTLYAELMRESGKT
jgi:alpha-galactosidase